MVKVKYMWYEHHIHIHTHRQKPKQESSVLLRLLFQRSRKPNSKYVAGRKGNRSNQPTCALLGHNCFKLATGHCLASSTTTTAIVLVGGWAISQNKSKTGRNNPSFPICFSTPFHQSRLTVPWKNQQEVHSLKPMQWVIHCANDDFNMSPQGKIKLVIFTSNASYQTSQPTLTTFSNNWLRSRDWRKWPRSKKQFSFPLKKWVLNKKRVTNRAGEEFNSIPWSKIYNFYLPTEYQNTSV